MRKNGVRAGGGAISGRAEAAKRGVSDDAELKAHGDDGPGWLQSTMELRSGLDVIEDVDMDTLPDDLMRAFDKP